MAKILEKINSPADIKSLSLNELNTLAAELREVIIATCAANGGHLAPSLGVVELTIALHRVFASPQDKIVWDVGHQAYAHKLLTGRRERFGTLRTLGGISGFPKRDESPHAAFDVGHASTSISAALGMAVGRDLKKAGNKVIAVIGDGSMTGGLAFQIADDILDIEGTTEEIGKDAGSDVARGKATYPAVMGIAEAKRRAAELAEMALDALSAFDEKSDPLREIARYVVYRKS